MGSADPLCSDETVPLPGVHHTVSRFPRIPGPARALSDGADGEDGHADSLDELEPHDDAGSAPGPGQPASEPRIIILNPHMFNANPMNLSTPSQARSR